MFSSKLLLLKPACRNRSFLITNAYDKILFISLPFFRCCTCFALHRRCHVHNLRCRATSVILHLRACIALPEVVHVRPPVKCNTCKTFRKRTQILQIFARRDIGCKSKIMTWHALLCTYVHHVHHVHRVQNQRYNMSPRQIFSSLQHVSKI